MLAPVPPPGTAVSRRGRRQQARAWHCLHPATAGAVHSGREGGQAKAVQRVEGWWCPGSKTHLLLHPYMTLSNCRVRWVPKGPTQAQHLGTRQGSSCWKQTALEPSCVVILVQGAREEAVSLWIAWPE